MLHIKFQIPSSDQTFQMEKKPTIDEPRSTLFPIPIVPTPNKIYVDTGHGIRRKTQVPNLESIYKASSKTTTIDSIPIYVASSNGKLCLISLYIL